jgi:hypothetical protein
MTTHLRVALAALALAAAAASAAAQPRPEEVFQRDLFLERDVRERLAQTVPTEQTALLEWGGFYMPSYTFYDDIDGGHAHVTRQDLRLWAQLQLDQVHRVFARMKMNYIDFAAGDAHGFRQHDLEGPKLEVGFYEVDLSAAAKRYAGQDWPFRAMVRGGRQYIEVGRGIAMGMILDAGLFQVDTKDVSFRGFAGQSISSEDNIDRSVPGFTNSERNFFGGEVKLTSIDRHEPYMFFVIQRDQSGESPFNPVQDYHYDSEYVGLGSRGSLATNLQYAIENIWQTGRTPANGQENDEEPIRAYAFNAELDYYCPRPMKPVASLEYGYASGDGDRGRATTAALGNTAGTDDHAFQGFGYVNSGLALAARFTNLQFVRMGGRLTPVDKKTRCGRVDVGADYYFLFKADKDGPISDFRANDTSADVGQEIDLYVEWRITSDLSWTLRYARFFPGQAYSDRDPRDFLFTGLNISF